MSPKLGGAARPKSTAGEKQGRWRVDGKTNSGFQHGVSIPSPRSRGGDPAGGESHHASWAPGLSGGPESVPGDQGEFRDSFRRRVTQDRFRGRLPGFRVIAEPLAFPCPKGTVAGGALMGRSGLEGCGSPVTVAGPRPICTAFPFSPELGSGAPAEQTR